REHPAERLRNRHQRHGSLLGLIRSRFAAALGDEANAFDAHAALDRLDHVVDGETGDRHCGQRLHLDPGAAADLHGGADLEGGRRAGWISRAIGETGSGGHSGMSSGVRFAAMRRAMRATPITSPFAALPLSTRSSVFAAMTTRPSAIACRSVTAFGDTSTMRA